MPPNDGRAEPRRCDARAYSYEAGDVGPVLAREIAVETPIEIALAARPSQ